ncbi:MAG: protein kinase [Bdellovibrionales bacterium]|nr:protein kinase [Bdellovibrionales bacterium]
MKKEWTSSPKTYRLLDCLHESENSKVFKVLCLDRSSNWSQVMAMKVLQSKNSFQDCVNEFESLKKVKSPDCVSVYSWEWIDERPALILEYLESTSLKKIASFYNLSKDEILYIAEKVHSGLIALKSGGLCHGDLSLSNILIDIDGHVKLIDYGLGNVYGRYTPNFVAPEVLASQKYSYAADLYSLGKILQFLGAGQNHYLTLIKHKIEQRQFHSSNYKSAAQNSLSQKVRQLCVKDKDQSTQLMNVPVTNKIKLKLINLIVFLFVNSSTTGHFYNKPLPAFISIKSQSWLEIKFNNRSVGFAPFFNKKVSSGQLMISWRGPNGTGESTLTLLPGEHRVLSNFK